MTPSAPFFLPTIGLTLLFAAFGPAIGGALFIPLAALIEAPVEAGAIGHIGWVAGLIGHAAALIPAYILGIGPAAATGFAYALWDAWAPRGAPRALGAAAIGGIFAYLLFIWLAHVGVWIESWIRLDVSASAGSWIDDVFSGEFDSGLQKALVASGAVAALVCAFAANLLGLTTLAPLPPDPAAP